MPEIIQIDENTWRFEDGTVRFFLLTGETDALMIDTGMNVPDAKKRAEHLTDLPIRLLNTHADPDHVSGNAVFGEFYMHPDEWGNFHDLHGNDGKLIPVRDGDRIDLGGRTLKIIDLPGHTPGSIAVLDVEKRVLFSGDSVQDDKIFMFGERRDLSAYIVSLKALWENHRDEFDTVYPCHGSFPVLPDLIPKLICGAEEILAGKRTGVKTQVFGHDVMYQDIGCAVFLCDRPQHAIRLMMEQDQKFE